jgi:aspartyl-tRNA(Asn)/glutamyl-tRNA(Gln) amidotransferase subunit B
VVELSAARIADIEAAMPELPEVRRARFAAAYGLPAYDAAELTRSRETADYFEAVARAAGNPKAAANWIMGELSRKLKETGGTPDRPGLAPEALAGLIALVDNGTINSTTAKDVFEKMYGTTDPADEIVRREGLAQISDEGALLDPIRRVLDEHADAVAQYRGGKKAAFGFLVGQVMRAMSGKASPQLVNELLRQELDRA